MRPPPPRPTGSNAEARFAQWVYDTLIALQNMQAPGTRVNRTTRGVQISAAPARLRQPTTSS
jgi:hypothetical protein